MACVCVYVLKCIQSEEMTKNTYGKFVSKKAGVIYLACACRYTYDTDTVEYIISGVRTYKDNQVAFLLATTLHLIGNKCEIPI